MECVCVACNITRIEPTRTCRGWMSPKECVSSGRMPNLSSLRRWGRLALSCPDAEAKGVVGSEKEVSPSTESAMTFQIKLQGMAPSVNRPRES